MRPPTWNLFALVDGAAGDGPEDQVLFFLRPHSVPGDHESTNTDAIFKKVGLLQAMGALSSQFNAQSQSTRVRCVETDKGRTIMAVLEGCYWFFWDVVFGDENGVQSSKGLAPTEWLRQQVLQGYNLWCLNFGTFEQCIFEMGKDVFQNKCSQWWQQWFERMFGEEGDLCLDGNGALDLYSGVKYSCVDLPLGFEINTTMAITEIINSVQGLVHMAVLNVNWSPESSWGVIYSHETDFNVRPLFQWLESVDERTGISTASLLETNTTERGNTTDSFETSDAINTNFFERSVVQPATALQTTFNDNLVTPVFSMLGTASSYIPGAEYVPNVFSYWSQSQNVSAQPVPEQVSASEPVLDPQPETGNYVLGKLSDGSECAKKIHIANKNNFMRLNLVVYKRNGMLFALLFDSIPKDYTILKTKLDRLFNIHFQDLVISQKVQHQKESKNDTFVSFENGKIHTNLPRIPSLSTEIASNAASDSSLALRTDIIAKHNLLIRLHETQRGPFSDWKKTREKLRISGVEQATFQSLSPNAWRVEWHIKG